MYYQVISGLQGRKIDTEAARYLLKALQYEPSNFLAILILSCIYLLQADVTGSRMMLDDAIDFIESAVVQTPADHEEFSSILRLAALCLIERAQFDSCHEDLEIAAQLLRVGLALPNLASDDPALLRLLLAEIYLLQFENLENPEDIDRVATLLGQVPSTYPVQAQHEPYLNGLRGKMYKVKWRFSRTGSDFAASFSAYATMFKAIQKNSACPSWKTIDALLGGADLLGELCNKDRLLSKSYEFAIMAGTLARLIASEWCLSSISRVEAQAQFFLGKILRARYDRYRASQLLDNAISAFRQSVRMTDLKDANFVERACTLSSVLRTRSNADQINHYQRQADLYEARHWAGKLIWSRLPLRRWQHVGCILELGHLLWESGAPVDRVIPLYQRAVELDTMHFDYRVGSWRSLAQALMLRGRNTNCIEDLDTARAYLDRVEMLERERNYRFTGRLPVAASLQSEYNRSTVSDLLLWNACYLVPLNVFSLAGACSQFFPDLPCSICTNAYHVLFHPFAGRPLIFSATGTVLFYGTGTMEIADVM